MNRVLNLNFQNKLDFYENFYVYTVLLSYFFLWDISYKTFSFKYSIFLIFIFIIIKKIKLNNLKYPIYALIFLILHLLFNKLFFNVPITFDNFKGVVLVFTTFLFIAIFKNKILGVLNNLYLYFPILFIPLTLITLEHDSLYYKELDFKCSLLMFDSPIFKKVFLENSHFGMILPSLIIYNFYQLSIESKSFTKNYIRYITILLILISSLLYGSTTLSFGLIISIIFIFLFFYKELTTYFKISLIFILLSYTLVFLNKGSCNTKITDLPIYINQIENQKINFEKNKILNEEIKITRSIKFQSENQLGLLFKDLENDLTKLGLNTNKYLLLIKENDFNFIINFLKNEEIIINKNIINKIKNIYKLKNELNDLSKEEQILNIEIKTNDNDIKTNFNTVNLSTQVIIKSLITAYNSFLENPLGYGVNSYEYAYFKFNTTELKKSFFSKDTFYINYNDAASNFPKIITEFGLFNIFLIILFLNFIFNKNIDFRYKMMILPIVLTLNLRAAGYFNAGFTLCIIQVLFLFLHKNDKTK